MKYQPIIGLEVHAEMLTRSKMFCGCAVVDSTMAEPNRHVCPICAGMPGMLPVINQRAVEFALRVALALNCTINPRNVFARKNYFYPDLPKGYQISQYELPLGEHGHLMIETETGLKRIGITRVHMEEDTGKLYHMDEENRSLVDLNRSGVPLLEIVSEPDLRSVEEVKAYATKLRSILRYLGVNSGDMEKGVIRFEANISVRETGSDIFNTRTEIKNLNSFRALVRGSQQEIDRQSEIYRQGGTVKQQTLGYNDASGTLFAQRSKEQAHDYRYFPEPDLPPLQLDMAWVEQLRAGLPELPDAIHARYLALGLSDYDSSVLIAEQAVTRWFDAAVTAGEAASPPVEAKTIVNWLTGELFGIINAEGGQIDTIKVTPPGLVELIALVESDAINARTAKKVLREMYDSGQSATAIVEAHGLKQVSDEGKLAEAVAQIIASNPEQVAVYLGGKDTVAQWFFGQVMRQMRGQANPQVVRAVLDEALAKLKAEQGVE